MRLSSLADYAVVMMTAAARHGTQAGLCPTSQQGFAARLNATQLSEETGVPLPTAQKLVSRLAAAGLLESARGTGGGFRLARSPSAISLADVIEAVEGRIALTTCVDDTRHDCALDGHCAVKPHWGIVNEAVRGALAGVSLARLATTTPVLNPAPRATTRAEVLA
ncbi:RrF2 family transcriptional regulator [Sphingomonas sp.]|uniref:RrF2 family transcriptional regulator n=1 Tax=Sphingomonas sp. TaxID=28214 RepID=UPI0035BC83ED